MGTLVFQATLGGSVNLIGPNIAGTVNFTLPSADGTNGQALTTNGSGTLAFTTISATPGGSTTQVQYNNAGAFAGSANLTFNGTTLTAANTSITTSETLSYGTANGVTYLNGSKVLTSGSTFVFDGTNVGIGTASPQSALHVAGAMGGGGVPTGIGVHVGTTSNYGVIQLNGASNAGSNIDFSVSGTDYLGRVAYDNTNNYMSFGTNSAERARITSAGIVLFGLTSPNGIAGGALFQVSQANNNWVSLIDNTQSTGAMYCQYLSLSGQVPNNTTSSFLLCKDFSTERLRVYSNGGIANYSANNVNLSDRREKTNFSPAKSYLDVICSIPVQTYNYIDQNLEEDGGLTLGVVAQDVQAVAPELVTESNWGTEDEPKMRLSIYQTDMQYALMKALQELKAEFDAYKASHP